MSVCGWNVKPDVWRYGAQKHFKTCERDKVREGIYCGDRKKLVVEILVS